jgi:GR25 family glycosyltransferase involved in LPS biosynthesis
MYNYFDSIICVSLEEATERREQCVKNFEKLGITNYKFYKTHRHKEGGRFGCFISHINIIKNEYDKGSETVLIFEDDFMPSSSYNENIIQEVINFKKDWDIIYLGHSSACNHRPVYSPKRITKHIYKMKPCFTHAYTISRKCMFKVLKAASTYLEKTEPKNVIHYDTFLYDIIDQSYGVLPSQFVQNMCIESYNSKDDASIREKILRLIPFFMKKSGLSKTCDASYGLSLLVYYNTIVSVVFIMAILVSFTYKS